MKPYIDKSTNEKGELEISIHGLSPSQFGFIQMFMKAGTERYGKWFERLSSDPIVSNIDGAIKTIKEFNPNA